MPKKIYGIMGATGQIGHVIALRLLQEGYRVKAIARNRKKLEFLESQGAQRVHVDSFDKEHLLVQAFQGCDALFCMIPPKLENYLASQDRIGETIKSAIKKSSIYTVVNLSSIGAQLHEGTGPIKGLYRQEQRLNTLPGVDFLHLRPAYFMENLFMTIPNLKQTGVLKSTAHPDLPLPMIATRDIGEKATEFLEKLNFRGHTVFELSGPRDYTMREVASILGREIGKPNLQYVQQSYEEAQKEMVAFGMKPVDADLIVEMDKAFNAGKIVFTEDLTAEHRGKTTLEQFAKVFAQVYSEFPEKQAV